MPSVCAFWILWFEDRGSCCETRCRVVALIQGAYIYSKVFGNRLCTVQVFPRVLDMSCVALAQPDDMTPSTNDHMTLHSLRHYNPCSNGI